MSDYDDAGLADWEKELLREQARTGAVKFSLQWDDFHLFGELPPDIATRVIDAAMRPAAVITFPGNITKEQADEARRRFTGRFGGTR